MGSKKLKAFSVRGKGKVTVADPEKMKDLNKKFMNKFKKIGPPDKISVMMLNFVSKIIGRTGIAIPTQPSTVRLLMKQYGTGGLTGYSSEVGDSPVKNWDGVGYKEFPVDTMSYKLSDKELIKNEKKKYHCQACPLGCGGIFDIKTGKYKGTEGHKPEYETLCAFGALILHDDLDEIVEINEMCNRAGIDTISTGGTVAFAIECFEKGIITEKDTGGLELGWGKSAEIKKLVEMIIERKGIGDLLADGSLRRPRRSARGRTNTPCTRVARNCPCTTPSSTRVLPSPISASRPRAVTPSPACFTATCGGSRRSSPRPRRRSRRPKVR